MWSKKAIEIATVGYDQTHMSVIDRETAIHILATYIDSGVAELRESSDAFQSLIIANEVGLSTWHTACKDANERLDAALSSWRVNQ